MAFPGVEEQRRFDKKLYEALKRRDDVMVFMLCRQAPEGPLHPLTMDKDTVLHLATYHEREYLSTRLLWMLQETDRLRLMEAKNRSQNTILHEAATSSKMIPVAEEILRKAPQLLAMRNNQGETALFRAARLGKIEMFKFLDDRADRHFLGQDREGLEKIREDMYVRDDKTTILHASIVTNNFGLACHIARKHEYLVNAKDVNQMTALQLLASNRSAFKHGSAVIRFLERLLPSCKLCRRVPLWEEITRMDVTYKSAVHLAKILIEKDNTSWKATEFNIIANNPLFLAVKSGILEIVEEIHYRYPQAIHDTDDKGRNILYLAIKYHHIHIIDFIENLEFPMISLKKKIDEEGNSILHMVGIKDDNDTERVLENTRNPVMILQEEWVMYERIKKISRARFTERLNKDGRSAKELFNAKNGNIRNAAQEWMKRTAEHCTIVAMLIATVAFSAAYRVPGGPDQNTGYPFLLNQSFFVIFTLSDALSVTFALTSVVAFLSILTSSFRLKDFKRSLPRKLFLGVTLLILSVSMMMLAFGATMILLHNKQRWMKIAMSIVILPGCILAISYLPLYVELVKVFFYPAKKRVSPA